jgi:tRNA-specific 2-thiouridylase
MSGMHLGRKKIANYFVLRSVFTTFVAMIQNEEIEGKRIALLLSGGVDSAVALHQLCELGQKPDCFYIKIGATPDAFEEGDLPGADCTMEEDMEMATSVAHKYGCRLEVVDCHREYWDQVTTYTMEKVRAGLTPNPDVMCNRLIKFGAFDEKRGHEYDLIATGHYAQTATASPKKGGSPDAAEHPLLSEGGGGRLLCTSPDPVKDQTDFLAQLYWWQLQKALFPIGHMMKDEVRQIAEREHLVNAKRKDSQGICFLGKINYNDYIRHYLGELPGDVVELETGRKIGRHKGLWFHTIGQRHGLGFGGGPWFAVKKDMATNILYVSHGYDPQTAYKQDFKVKGMNWLAPVTPSQLGEGITFKIRHTPEFHKGSLTPHPSPKGEGNHDSFTIVSEEPIHGVAPGQFCVIYDAEHHYCFGSGEITI